MKEILSLMVLTVAFSVGHLVYSQECNSTCNCRGNYEITDYGCQYTELSCGTGGGVYPNCSLLGSHCCYYEEGTCERTSCPNPFFFRKCYLDSCNY